MIEVGELRRYTLLLTFKQGLVICVKLQFSNYKLFLEELKHETATFDLILVIGSFGSNSVECIGIKGVFNYHVFDPVKSTVGGGGYFYNGCPNQIITVCSSMAVW